MKWDEARMVLRPFLITNDAVSCSWPCTTTNKHQPSDMPELEQFQILEASQLWTICLVPPAKWLSMLVYRLQLVWPKRWSSASERTPRAKWNKKKWLDCKLCHCWTNELQQKKTIQIFTAWTGVAIYSEPHIVNRSASFPAFAQLLHGCCKNQHIPFLFDNTVLALPTFTWTEVKRLVSECSNSLCLKTSLCIISGEMFASVVTNSASGYASLFLHLA